ncbi:isochorismatase hydrolase [Desulfovibrio sp. X2]|uniref:cysteine hydrolase family protein n=1 Tax=Desulfovibrio sp. X2 TaxID=941449 RepID=UPI000358E86D|nr:cysteine hydrolase family protein [Desulfovibrio sp. X2]EPR42371.1 isochorismatase hydrolase [Desulfovibrio sp. X2]
MTDTALVLVDIQNDYFPGGRMALEHAVEAGAKATAVLSRFRELGLPVVHVRHESVRPGSTFFLPGTPGCDFPDIVAPLPGEAVVTKNFPNSFRGTDLEEKLGAVGAKRLVVAGMMTNMCIDATVRAAWDMGYACVVAGDATAACALKHGGVAVTPSQARAAFLAALGMVYAEVVETDALCAALAR